MEIEDIYNKTISDMENEKKENLIITDEYKSEHLLNKEIIGKNFITEDDKLKQILTLVEKIKFPFYNLNYTGIDYYKDKYIYLLSAVICNKKRIYPDSIKWELDPSIMETKKRLFGNSVTNYGLDNNYYLCYKYTKEEKKLELSNRRGDNRHI